MNFKVKHMSLYHQRRFAKLGHSAASILSALPLLQMLLLETEKDNLLVQACRMYIECEFFISELQALAYFTHKVTLPLLNCVEVCDQLSLLTILPQLYNDLCVYNMNTLDKYSVVYKHLEIKEPDNDLVKEIIRLMCIDAANGIKLQCGREYGFSDSNARATQLYKLTPVEFSGLATNNLEPESDFSKFSRLAEVAKFRNNKFKAKGIRNDMVLYKSEKGKVASIARKIKNVLEDREKEWNTSQKNLLSIRIKEKLDKSDKTKDYLKKLLQNCKIWGGPCTTGEELQSVLLARPDNQEKIVKTELTYYRNTHKSHIIAQPDLFRINKITHEERLENLMILLSDDDCATGSIADLPSNEDALNILKGHITQKTSTFQDININTTCAIAWYRLIKNGFGI